MHHFWNDSLQRIVFMKSQRFCIPFFLYIYSILSLSALSFFSSPFTCAYFQPGDIGVNILSIIRKSQIHNVSMCSFKIEKLDISHRSQSLRYLQCLIHGLTMGSSIWARIACGKTLSAKVETGDPRTSATSFSLASWTLPSGLPHPPFSQM